MRCKWQAIDIRALKRLAALRFAPGAQVHCVESNTEQVRGNEAELRRPQADEADDRAIDSRQNPTLPATFSD